MGTDLLFVVGARPNFVKAAPLLRAVARRTGFGATLVHTGQHYDASLSELFFRDLELPLPDLRLEAGSGTHAEQTAAVMRGLEPILIERRPACVVVFGDVNSTLAASLTAAKLCLPVAHVEAGLRSFDPSMPEEINRRVTDCVSQLLFTTEPSGNENLAREGVPGERVHFVGNTMVDSLREALGAARKLRGRVLGDLGVEPGGYAVLTLHRPSNVDPPEALRGLATALTPIGERLPILFPAHPRTRGRLAATPDAAQALDAVPRLSIREPLPYLEFLGLMDGARLVLTDSGGIQEETTVLGVPCLTLRENTERPITVERGTNRLVGSDPRRIAAAALHSLAGERQPPPEPPPLWDGCAAERIAAVLSDVFTT